MQRIMRAFLLFKLPKVETLIASLALLSFVHTSGVRADDMVQITPANSNSSGHQDIEHHAQQWSVLVLQGKLVGSIRGYLEVQPRTDLNEGELDRILIRPAIFTPIGRSVTLWAGYAAVGSFSPEVSWEHRAWQQVQHEANFGGVIVINRSRFEERVLPNSSEVGLRIRHMLRAVIPVDDRRVWAVVFSDEIFFNLNSPASNVQAGFDQNRAFAGISWTITPNIRIEGGYMNNFVNRPDPNSDRMNHIALLLMAVTF